MVSNFLELKDIIFYYKENKLILNKLNVNFESGKINVIIGINGSGKTTLFKIMTGIYKPKSGNIFYNGDLINDSNIINYKSIVGFMPEFLQLYKNMKVYDVLKLFSSLKGFDNTDVNEVLKMVYLYDHKYKKVSDLSKGMKQRLNLSQAIIGNSKIILFDEPSNGFDCGSILMFYRILRNIADNGSIVLMSSHHLTEIYGNVDNVLILSNGTILKNINLSDINSIDPIKKNIYIVFDKNLDIKFLSYLNYLSYDLKISNNFLSGKLHNNEIINLFSHIISNDLNIKDIRIESTVLEKYLVELS